MRRVQHGTPITDFGGRKQISFDALFSSDSEEEVPVEVRASSGVEVSSIPASSSNCVASSSHCVASSSNCVASSSHCVASSSNCVASSSHCVASPPSPDFPYRREDDPISVWTQKVTESFEKASQSKKQLPSDFKESLGRLSFFRKPQQQQQNLVPKEHTSTTTVNSQ